MLTRFSIVWFSEVNAMTKLFGFFLSVVFAAFLSAGLAFAQSTNTFPPVDLPEGHWAWGAVDAMMGYGILEGYPGNEFRGDRDITRYEFASALYSMILYIETKGAIPTADVKAMIDALEDEFSAELADISARVDENTEGIEMLEGSLTEMGERVETLEHRVGNIRWSGVFRFRFDFNDKEAADTDQFRERISLKIAFDAPIVEDVLDFHGRLTSGPGGTTTNQTLGNNFRNYGIGIDRAYLDYRASWIPVKNNLYFGRFKNFLMWNNPVGIVWDSDINFDGTGQHFEFEAVSQSFEFNAIQAILKENSAAFVEDDEWVIGWQLGSKDFIVTDLNWYASYYHFQNIVGGANSFSGGYLGNLAGGGVDVNLDGAINSFDSIATKYNILNLGANYTFNTGEGGVPIYIHGDYVANLDPSVPFGVDTRLGIDDEDHIGFAAGFRYGKAKTKGTWQAGYYYKNIGATAGLDHYADGDDYGSNVVMHNLYFDYKIADNTKFGLEFLTRDLKNDFGYLADDTRNLLYLNMVVNF